MAAAHKKRDSLHSAMGRPAQGTLSSYPSELREQIKKMRGKEEGWGPGTIRVELQRQHGYSSASLPCVRSIAEFLREQGLVKVYEPHQDLPDKHYNEPQAAHDLWQLDGRGNEVVQIGYTETPQQSIALLDIKDVFTHAYICCFPAPMVSQQGHPGTPHYQSALRLAFVQHGMPIAIQTDNASVFKDNRSKSPFPTQLHLWLKALGIHLHHCRVHQPTDQGQVERSHEIFYNQILKGDKTFKNWEHLYQKCQERRQVLNEEIASTSCANQAPLIAHPQAKHSQRMYHPQTELELMDMQRVYDFLAKGKWFRKVATNKTISLGGQIYYLSNAKPSEQLEITFCNKCQFLLFQNDKELLVALLPIKGLNKRYLMGKATTIFTMPSLQLPIPFDWKQQVDTTLLHST